MKIEFSPIGIIHSPYTEPAGVPIQCVFANCVTGTVEVFPEFAEGLTDLDGFSHIILLYRFHRVQGHSLMCRPFLDVRDHGIFATRAPRRPNPIGLSVVELLKIDGCLLTIGGVDIVDGTPLLDIKPYVPDFDVRENAKTGWYEHAGNKQQTVADDRFFNNEEKKREENKAMLLEALKKAALEKAEDIKVTDVRIGLGYTAVQLDTGSVGLAYTFRDKAESGCSVFHGKRPLAGTPVRDILQYITSAGLLERTLGLAAANALFNTADGAGAVPGCSSAEGDLLDVLALTKDDRVGMVGFFGPLVPVIKQRAGELIVFEENMTRADGLCPGSRETELLPTCSVAIITATSIINNSFEHIANAAANCRIKAVLGPSTPMAPGVFKDYGVTHLSGVVGIDAAAILRVVSEGGGTRFFMEWSKKINLVLNG